MPSELTVTVNTQIAITETFTGDYVDPGNPSAGFTGLSESNTYTADTDVPVTKHAEFQVTLSTGGEINLAALPGKTAEETVNGTGLKLQVAKFRAHADNAATVTIAVGETNGYEIAGADFTIDLEPGQSVTLELKEASPAIASGARIFDLSGTDDDIVEVCLVMG